jgi:hypothetical protein
MGSSDFSPHVNAGASQTTHGITSPTLALEGAVCARCKIT